MNIAILGGTHGNEPVGVEVIKRLDSLDSSLFKNSFKTFLGNPKAYDNKSRYIDCDLNRCFGSEPKKESYEYERAEYLKKEISGKFDFLLDLHTTTSNMGLTLILAHTNELTRKAAAYIQSQMPEVKILETSKLDEEGSYTNRLAPHAITVEVGPVANNVVDTKLVFQTMKIAETLLNWDGEKSPDLQEVIYYKSIKDIHFPQDGDYFIDSRIDGHDFKELHHGDALFEDWNGETIDYQDQEIAYPIFINEAAYQELRIAMTLMHKKTGFS